MIISYTGKLAEQSQFLVRETLQQAILKELYGDDYNYRGNCTNHFSIIYHHNHPRSFRDKK